MNSATRDDYFWLVSSEAGILLNQCRDAIVADTNIVRIAKSLRRETSPTRSALILEMAQLRIRAGKKFANADEMFFTRRGYEQATSRLIAEYKAKNFVHFDRVVDVCCGIGGDLLALANRNSDGETVGVDQEPLVCLFATKNVEMTRAAARTTIIEAAFEDFDSRPFDAMHIDPDRRVHGRTVQPNYFKPTIQNILARNRPASVAIKMAPASPKPDLLPPTAELEWIGTLRECKQQMIWLGPIATNPGCLTATSVAKDGTFERFSMSTDEIDQTIVVANDIGPFVFEPDPSVLAAFLTDTIANQRRLSRLDTGIVYLTGDRPNSTELLKTYKVIQILPLNIKTVAAELKRLDAGRVDFKKRGVEKIVADQFGRLKFPGQRPLTVLLTRHKKRGIAVIAKRVSGNRKPLSRNAAKQ